MTLWFDVTDIQNWTHPHLTGIQRTSVNVLSELLVTRKDVRLFVFVPSENVLRRVEIYSLPRIVLDCILKARPEIARELPAISTLLPRISFEDGIREFIFQASYSVKARLRRQPRKWFGPEITDALKEFLRSGRNLVRIVWRQLFGRAPTAKIPDSFSVPVFAKSSLFKRGDVCISLAATWGIPRYGDVIAVNTRQSGVNCINLIYDLIPTLYPQWVLPDHHVFITAWVRQQIENADVILTISEFQKKEISRYIADQQLSPKPIEFIRLGDNPNLAASANDQLQIPRYVPDRKFAIFVSTIDVRKNQGLLYHVWRQLAEDLGSQCPQLLLIGSEHLHVTDILYQIRNDSRVRGLVVHLRGVTDEELAWYYRHCEFTLYPSFYEGWGLPVSESLSLGKYCIAGNRASLPEAGGDLIDYFDPRDFVGCYNLVYRAVTDPEYVRRCEERIRANYEAHSWAKTAAHISEIVDRLGGPDQSPAA